MTSDSTMVFSHEILHKSQVNKIVGFWLLGESSPYPVRLLFEPFIRRRYTIQHGLVIPVHNFDGVDIDKLDEQTDEAGVVDYEEIDGLNYEGVEDKFELRTTMLKTAHQLRKLVVKDGKAEDYNFNEICTGPVEHTTWFVIKKLSNGQWKGDFDYFVCERKISRIYVKEHQWCKSCRYYDTHVRLCNEEVYKEEEFDVDICDRCDSVCYCTDSEEESEEDSD